MTGRVARFAALLAGLGGFLGAQPTVAREAPPLSARQQVMIVHGMVDALTSVMVHDIFSPPQASRSYAYPMVAFYEAFRHSNPAFRSYAGQLNGLGALPAPGSDEEYSWLAAGMHAFTRVAEQMVFSQERFREAAAELNEHLRAYGLPDDVRNRSIAFGDRVAEHVLSWAAEDGYAHTRKLSRYSVSTGVAGTWEPTPPAYMDAVEPYWGALRPFVLAAGDQFVPERPNQFDTTGGAPFYHEMLEVLNATRHLTAEQREIAGFWDCNPFVVHQQGHLSFGLKKITPGGHWMGITGIAIDQKGSDPVEAVAAYSLVAIAIADGFISAWDEKYRSNRVRPETVIRRHLDPDWQPLLQTPPFPEYTSAHSVISTAAATVLTRLFGESFTYTDDVEEAWGLAPRRFNSFREAAQEAAISRLYGGIHYMPSIAGGISQGTRVGEEVVGRIDLWN